MYASFREASLFFDFFCVLHCASRCCCSVSEGEFEVLRRFVKLVYVSCSVSSTHICTHTHTRAHTQTYTRAHTYTHTIHIHIVGVCCGVSGTRTCTHTHTHTLSLSLTHTHTHTHSGFLPRKKNSEEEIDPILFLVFVFQLVSHTTIWAYTFDCRATHYNTLQHTATHCNTL